MKQETQSRNTSVTGALSSKKFGISDEDQSHIIGILRDRLYSDKPLAVLREYSTNAADAHVEAGIPDRPIRVVLPTILSPVLRIRDYGLGIPKDSIANVFVRYGKSTKRGNNQTTGMLGIGCKSGFAYSDTFSIINHHDGIKTVYSAIIDDSDLGDMIELAAVPTAETGVEISIPVQIKHVSEFREKAYALFQNFDVTPNVNMVIPKRTYTETGTGWSVRDSSKPGAVAIMGNIGYQIKPERLLNVDKSLRDLLTSHIDFHFPIGALNIAASREDLEYKAKTINAITTALRICQRELSERILTSLNSSKSIWEARNAYFKALYLSTTTLQKSVLAAAATWDGKAIESSVKISDVGIFSSKLANNSGELVTRQWCKSYHRYNSSEFIVVADVKSAWNLRSGELVTQEQAKGNSLRLDNAIMLRKEGVSDAKTLMPLVEKWMETNGYTGAPIYRLSDYSAPKKNVSKAVNKHLKSKAFELNMNGYIAQRQKPSNNWIPTTCDFENGSGVYLVLDRFRTNFKIDGMKRALKLLGKDLPTVKIIGIRSAEKVKLGKKWVEVNTWYNDLLKAEILANPEIKEDIKTSDIRRYKHCTAWLESVIKLLEAENCTGKLVSNYKDILAKVRSSKAQDPDAKTKFLKGHMAMCGVTFSSLNIYSVSDRISEVAKLYPMLRYTNLLRPSYGSLRALGEGVADYIKLIDSK